MKGGKGSGRPGRKNYEVGRRRDVRSFRDLASVQKENEDSCEIEKKSDRYLLTKVPLTAVGALSTTAGNQFVCIQTASSL